jgi:predicted RNA-binding Zn ribbon-like protein
VNFDAYKDLSVVTAVDLVNTLDVVTGQDMLSGPDHLAKFLDDHLDSYARPLTREDVSDIQGLRERLRLAFTLGSIDTVVDLLNDLMAESSALPQLTDHDGVWHFHFTPPESSLFAHMAAEAAMGLASVIRDHGLERLRVCAASGCQRFIFFTSRTRSRRYCNPDICGNRTNVAAFRARQRAAGANG